MDEHRIEELLAERCRRKLGISCPAGDFAVDRIVQRILSLAPEVHRQVQTAKVDVDRLLQLPEEHQYRRLRHHKSRIRTWPVVRELLDRSLQASFISPYEAEHLCALAGEICLWLSAQEELWRQRALADLQALVQAHAGNIQRILCDWDQARRRFQNAYYHLSQGSGDIETQAEIFNLHSSLLRDRDQLRGALLRLNQAIALYDQLGDERKKARSLISRGLVHRKRQDPEAALHDHQAACKCLAGVSDPQLIGATWINLALLYTDLGRYQEALDSLHRGPDLVQLCGPNSLILLNYTWVEGMAYHGLGLLDQAEQRFLYVRSRFQQQPHPYNVAYVNLDLAVVYAQQKRYQELRTVAERAYRYLDRQHLRKDARRALDLFWQSVRSNPSVEILWPALQRINRVRLAA